MEVVNIHHIAIIAGDYEKSKQFYTEILGLKILQENYREDRHSFKCDLAINDQYCIELFSFPNTPKRISRPEAAGLRHLAFGVQNVAQVIDELISKGIKVEPLRVDEFTAKKFTFLFDPDDLPIELYEL